MADLFGGKLGRDEILRRVGDMSQIAGARAFEFEDGPARGSRGIEVYTGSGFRFTALPDRAMDISSAEHSGRSLCWRSGTAETHPGMYQPEGIEWLYSFYGGLMVTCGLTHYGPPCVDEGETFGLHGRVSNIPAREVGVTTGWEGDNYYIRLKGKVFETRLFGQHLLLERTLTAWAGGNAVAIHDEVTNVGSRPCPHLMLYHCNFGFPVVADNSTLVAPSKAVTPRDATAEQGKEDYAKFHAPRGDWAEKVYYHRLYSQRGRTCAGIVNPDLQFGAWLAFRPSQLPMMTEWKQMGQGEYVVGLEPCTNPVCGRAELRERGELGILSPGEAVAYDLDIGALPDREAVNAFRGEVAALSRKRKPRLGRSPA